MAKYAILRLKNKLLDPKKKSFRIYEDDRKAMVEIIKYYNATAESTLQNNELLTKCLLVITVKELIKADNKSIGETMNEVFKKTQRYDLNFLYDFVSGLMDSKEWENLTKEVGMAERPHWEKISEADKKILEYNQDKFVKKLTNKKTPEHVCDLLKEMVAFIIQKDLHNQNKKQ